MTVKIDVYQDNYINGSKTKYRRGELIKYDLIVYPYF